MNKKTVVISAIAAAGILTAGGAAWYFLNQGQGNNKKDLVVYVDTVENVMDPSGGSGRINRFAGVVETQKQMDIQPGQDRVVKDILVEEGQEVSKGTVLFTYDTEKETDELSKAELELERIANTIQNKAAEIAALEKEKKKASKDAQLDYTMQIQGAQMELKQSEYEQKAKQVEIDKLKQAIENSQVTSQMDGVVKAIRNGEQQMMAEGESRAFMTLIAMGDYRIKGKVNEQNISNVMPGQPVLVRSRVDDEVIWKGTMGEVDMKKPVGDSNGYYSGDPSVQSSSYSFYVELDSSQGLMLGQHVYIEPDYGQEMPKEGIWLDEAFILSEEKGEFVWADNGKGKLEKREIQLGEYDQEMFRYEITEGLKEEDKITFPEPGIEEGMKTADGQNHQMGLNQPVEMDENFAGGPMEDGMMEDGMPEDGMMEDGMMEDGMPEDGMMEDGMMEDGMPEEPGMDQEAGSEEMTDKGDEQ